MGMLRFADSPPEVFVVPRIEDELIDDLFYQEDEIGEMRYQAFMIECGLEEDPPDGPDVPPIPWQFTPGSNSNNNPAEDETAPLNDVKATKKTDSSAKEHTNEKKKTFHRSSSCDDVEILEKRISDNHSRHSESSQAKERSRSSEDASNKNGISTRTAKELIKDLSKKSSNNSDPRSPPTRRLVAVKSGSLHGMRDAAQKAKDDTLSSPTRPEPKRGKLVATRSGSTLQAMRQKIKDRADDAIDSPKASTSPRRRSKLVATKSGTLHGMRKKLEEGKQNEEEKEVKKLERRVPTRGGLTQTKSGSLHALRKAEKAKEDEKTAEGNKTLKSVRSPTGNKSKTKSLKTRQDVLNKISKAKNAKKKKSSSSKSDSSDSMSTGSSSSSEDISISTIEDSDNEKNVPTKRTTTRSPPKVEKSTNGSKSSSSSKSSKKKTKAADSASPSNGKISVRERRASLEHNKSKDSSTTTATRPKRSSMEKRSAPKRSNSMKERMAAFEKGGDKSSDKDKSSAGVDKALQSLRNGKASPADLLRSMQAGKPSRTSKPTKAASVCVGMTAAATASTYRNQLSPTGRSPGARKQKLKVSSKSKTINNVNIPSAFRATS